MSCPRTQHNVPGQGTAFEKPKTAGKTRPCIDCAEVRSSKYTHPVKGSLLIPCFKQLFPTKYKSERVLKNTLPQRTLKRHVDVLPVPGVRLVGEQRENSKWKNKERSTSFVLFSILCSALRTIKTGQLLTTESGGQHNIPNSQK